MRALEGVGVTGKMAADRRCVCLTGVSGFLGKNLARLLVRSGYDVVGLKRASSDVSFLADCEPHIRYIDVDRPGWSEMVRIQSPFHAVIHTATNYGRTPGSTGSVIDVNLKLPIELLDIAIGAGTPLFVNIGTFYTMVVEGREYLLPYVLTKKHMSEWGNALVRDGNPLKFVDLRLFHLYGPGDAPSKFSSRITRDCRANIPHIDLTGGEQIRDFIFVDDACEAIRVVLDRYPSLERPYTALDLGSGTAHSLRDFVELIHSATASTTQLNFGAIPYPPVDIMHAEADVSTLHGLGWRAATPLEEGVRKMVAETQDHSCEPITLAS